MRSPLLKAALWLCTALLGAVLIAAALVAQAAGHGKLEAAMVAAPGLALIALSLFFGGRVLPDAVGEARLRSGKGLVVRWTVRPADWALFNDFDSRRSGEQRNIMNWLRVAKISARRPVAVAIGREQVLLGGTYFPLRRGGNPELRAAGWLRPQGVPECLEFDLIFPRGRRGGHGGR